LEKAVEKLKIKNLIFLGGCKPREIILNELCNSSIAVHVGEYLDYPTLAFKIWDYLSCNKKILYLGLNNSYTAKFLKKNDFGIILPLTNLKKASKILKNIINELKEGKFQGTIQNDKLKEATWDSRVKKLENFLRNNFF